MLSYARKLISGLRARKHDSYIAGLVARGMHLGEGTVFHEPFFLDPDHCFLISIGTRCTFAPNVRLIAHDASTKQFLGYTRVARIRIGDNCFLGDSVIVLPDVSIGESCIIGAGSLVTRDIPPRSVAVGSPARVICGIDEYLEKCRERAGETGVYGTEYHIDNITPERMQQMLAALESGDGYIV